MTDHPDIHPVRVTPMTESMFGLDGGAMFGIIPKPLWERTNPADDRNRIDMACRCMLIEFSDGTHAIVDVGMGTKWDDKERDIYKLGDQDPALERALAAAGSSPEQIDHVILTHLHFDHAGGVSKWDENGDVVPTFPNAKHWVQKRNWGWANSPTARDAGSFRPIDFSFFEEGDTELELVDGPSEILPGVEVFPRNGHTIGMQIVKVTTPDGIFAHLADLIPTASHLRDPYVMGYDIQPTVTVEEKREVLWEAVKNDWVIVYDHDPEMAMSRVEYDERDRPVAVPLDS